MGTLFIRVPCKLHDLSVVSSLSDPALHAATHMDPVGERWSVERRRTSVTSPPGRAVRWSDVPPLGFALAIGLAIPALIYVFARPLALLILAFTIAQALSPLADRLERQLPRALGATLLFLTIFALFGLLLGSMTPMLIEETRQFVARAPDLLDKSRQWLSSWTPISSVPLRDAVVAVLKNVQGTVVNLPFAAIGALFEGVVVLFLSLYLLIAGPRLKRFVLSLIPERRRRRASRVMSRMGHSMGGYVRGAAMSGVIVGILTWLALFTVGLEYRRVLALAAALGEFVPYLGPVAAAVPAVLVALSESPTTALIVALIYLGLQQLDSHLITPNVMKTQTDLHPALVVLALAAGFSVGGLIGALTALPTFAALRVLVLAAAPSVRRSASRR